MFSLKECLIKNYPKYTCKNVFNTQNFLCSHQLNMKITISGFPDADALFFYTGFEHALTVNWKSRTCDKSPIYANTHKKSDFFL